MLKSYTLALLLMAGTAVSLQAAVITSLHNTGVDGLGVSLADNAPDSHWSLVPPGAQTGSPLAATSAGGFPIPPWLGDSPDSAWITTLDPTALGPTDVTREYHYQTTFSLSGFLPATAAIGGRASQDNFLLDVLVNGVSTGINESAVSFGGWTDFSLAPEDIALLTDGDNTLTFIVQSATVDGTNDYTSLRVEFLTKDAALIPEPSVAGLLALGALGFLRRRRNTC